MKSKTFVQCIINIVISFFISCIFYFLTFKPFFFMSGLWDKNLSIIFIIQLVFMLSFISFLFFIPVLLLSVIIQWKFSDKLAFMINFIFFELYGYFIFILWFKFNESQVEYFIISIPLTIVFLFINYIIKNGIKTNCRCNVRKDKQG